MFLLRDVETLTIIAIYRITFNIYGTFSKKNERMHC